MGDNTAELFWAARIGVYKDRKIANIIQAALSDNDVRLSNLLDYQTFFTSTTREDYIETQLAAGVVYWGVRATEAQIGETYDKLRSRYTPLSPEKRDKLREFILKFPDLSFEEPYETEELYLVVTNSIKRMDNGGDFITIESTEGYGARIRAALEFFGVEDIDKIEIGWVLCGHYS